MDIQAALIVDDSKMAQIVLKKQLESKGISSNMVNSGEEAIEFLGQNKNQPDIIFMDSLMPGIDGFETTKTILEKPNSSGIPIVICTGKESENDKQKAFDLGASGYMRKSASSEPLQAILDKFSKPDSRLKPPKLTAPEQALIHRINNFDLKKVSQLSEKISHDIATDIATKISTGIAAEVANNVSKAHIISCSKKLISISNKQMVTLSGQLEEKIISTVKISLESIHNYIDSKVSHINKTLIPELKADFNNSVKTEIDALKSAQDQVDINTIINKLVKQKVHETLDNNLSTYTKVLLDHEVTHSLAESKVKKQLIEQNKKIHSLEETIAAKGNYHLLSIIALLLGTSALVISLYPLFKAYL